MSVLSQGTQIFALVKAASGAGALSVIEIDDVTAFSPGGAPASQVDTTNLKAKVSTFKKGLRTPGQASLTIQADSANASHMTMYELYEDDSDYIPQWVVGWPDGPLDEDGEPTALPTLNVAGTDFELPKTRTWYRFDGYVSDFPFDHAANAVITTAATIQRTGKGAWIKKTQ